MINLFFSSFLIAANASSSTENKKIEMETIYISEPMIKNYEDYSEIWFYYNPGRFHSLYERLLRETKLKDKLVMFSHKREIV